MNYQPTYPSSPDYVIEAEFTDLPKKREPFFQSWSAPKSLSPERAMQQIQVDRYHALLTASALRHTVALSAMEQKAVDFAPQGAHRYQAIVDGYAEAAARMIRRYR